MFPYRGGGHLLFFFGGEGLGDNDLNRGSRPNTSVAARKRRQLKPNTAVLITVLIVLFFLVLVGIYIFYNDVKVSVIL